MKNEKIFAVFAASLIILSGLGFAYAHWEDMVTVEGDAFTGILEMVLINPDQNIWVWYDDMWVLQEDLADSPYYLEEKIIMTCWWDDLLMEDAVYMPECMPFTHPCYWDDGQPVPYGWKEIKFYWSDVYPETAIRYEFEAHNIGTIPAHWVGAEVVDLMVDLDPNDAIDPVPVTEQELYEVYGVEIEVKAFHDGRVYTLPLDVEPQIHPCEGVIMWVEIYANDDLPQNADIFWKLNLEYRQYNWASVESYPDMPPDGGAGSPGIKPMGAVVID